MQIMYNHAVQQEMRRLGSATVNIVSKEKCVLFSRVDFGIKVENPKYTL